MMSQNEILAMLNRLEVHFRPQSPERLASYVEVLLRNKVTAGQLGDAVNAALDKCDNFPSAAALMRFARPEAVNQPRRDAAGVNDLADEFDREEMALRMWKRRFVEKGAYGEADRVQRRIDDIGKRRASRGLTTKLPGEVQNFDGTPVGGTPERDWCVADLVSQRTGQLGYPNALSQRASDAKLDRIIERFGPEAAFRVDRGTRQTIGEAFS